MRAPRRSARKCRTHAQRLLVPYAAFPRALCLQVNLKETIRAVKSRVIFINTGSAPAWFWDVLEPSSPIEASIS